MADENVNLSLTHDEALVLFEWLSVNDQAERLPIGDPAEQLALWRLHGQLEQSLVSPVQDDYLDQLRQARARLREQSGESPESDRASSAGLLAPRS